MSSRALPSTLWPPLDPPLLTRLPQPARHPDPASLPPSARYRSTQRPTLQDEAELLDYEEEVFLTAQAETRSHGYTWLVPLGRQNTQEEDAESACSPSPHPDSPAADQTIDEAPLPVAGMEGAAEAAEAPQEVDLDADIEDADQASPASQSDDSASEDEDEPDDAARVNSDPEETLDQDGEGEDSDGTGSTSNGRALNTADDATMQLAP